ncbi:MAG: hypothetical protein KDD47_12875, partial [Acidobacteria bacterium]|nr:hypothetical protein [Acidobacteriota bacterium]
LLDADLGVVAVWDRGSVVRAEPTQVFPHPSDPTAFLLKFPTTVQVLRVNPAGLTLTADPDPLLSTMAEIQTARPFLWNGHPTLLVVDRFGGIMAQTLDPSPQVLFDSTSTVRSRFHGVACDAAGTCFTVDRTTGDVWQLDDQGRLVAQVASEALGSFCPEGTELCAGTGNALARFGAQRSLIVGDDGSFYPVGQRAARLEVMDAQGISTPGDRIAYAEGGLLLVRAMTSGGCHYLGKDAQGREVPWSTCDSFSGGANESVVNETTFDPARGFYVDPSDWVKNTVNTFGQGVRYLKVDGDEILVATNETGWIRVFLRPSGATDFGLVADNRPVAGADIHYGRNCPALDVRVDPGGASPVEKVLIYRGCLARNNEGGRLEGWRLVPASGGALPFELSSAWEVLAGRSPTAVHFVDRPGGELGTLVVGDLWGHLYLFDATNPSVPPVEQYRSESLRGAVAPEGFEYFQDTAGKGHLYVTTGRGHYRYRFN